MSKNKGGRPRSLDEDKKLEAVALFSAGCSWKAAARYVGCSANTLRREADRDKAFGERLRQAQVRSQLEPLQALRKKAATHWRAAAWLLERIDPEQFVRFDRQLYQPQEVADLLENLKTVLEENLLDFPNRFIAVEIVSRAQREAYLPSGRRKLHVDMTDIPWPDMNELPPGDLDPFVIKAPPWEKDQAKED